MSGLEGARCANRPWLFLSTAAVDHEVAKVSCFGKGDEGRCPLFDVCEANLRDLQASHWQSGIDGTWAGQLYKNGKVKAEDGRVREHGTEKGYYQHKNRGEKACAGCLKGMRIATRVRRAADPNRTPVRGKIEAAQTGELALTNPGLAPVLSKQNERLTAS